MKDVTAARRGAHLPEVLARTAPILLVLFLNGLVRVLIGRGAEPGLGIPRMIGVYLLLWLLMSGMLGLLGSKQPTLVNSMVSATVAMIALCSVIFVSSGNFPNATIALFFAAIAGTVMGCTYALLYFAGIKIGEFLANR